MCGRLYAGATRIPDACRHTHLTRVLRRSCEDGRYTLRALAPIEEGSEVLISYRAQMSNRIYQVSSFSPPPLKPTLFLPPSSLAYYAQIACGLRAQGASG